MTIFDARSIPDEVDSSTKDPEIAELLETGPVAPMWQIVARRVSLGVGRCSA